MKTVKSLLLIICISVIFATNAYSQVPMFVSNSENIIRAEKVGNEIYFFKYADSSGTWITQLWKTNTSVSGATVVKSLSSLTVLPAGPLKVINNKLFFVADNQLWVSDGTSNGTMPLFTTDYSIYAFFEFNNNLYFSVYSLNPALCGMYISDGTLSGTTLLKNFQTRGLGDDGVFNYVEFNNKIIFTTKKGIVNPPTNHHMEIWSTDGTASGFVRLDSLYGDARRYAGGNGINAKSQYFREHNGYLYFVFINTVNSTDELWRTDGTVNNSSYFHTALHPIIQYDGKLILAGGNSSTGTELYSSDGTTIGTTLIKDINTSSPGFLGSNPSNFSITCNKLFFLAKDTGINVTNDSRIWVTDGTTNGTTLHTPARGSYYPITQQSNGVLYYAYQDNNNDSVQVFMVDTTTCNLTKILSWAYADYGSVSQIIQLNPLFVVLSGGSVSNWQDGLFGHGMTTSIPKISDHNNHQLKFFPNPCTSNLQVEFTDENCNYQIINTLGQIVQSGLLTDKVIPTGNLDKGFYILRIADSKFKTRHVGRFIKE